jgi:hypothetical protein
LLQGTWSEVLSHQDDIPTAQRVIVLPDLPDDDDPEEQERLQRVFDDLIKEVDPMDFTPPDGPVSAATEAVVKKFRRKGLIP